MLTYVSLVRLVGGLFLRETLGALTIGRWLLLVDSTGCAGGGRTDHYPGRSLAAIVSLPRVPLVCYAGCLAPHSQLREAMIPTPRQQGVDGAEAKTGTPSGARPGSYGACWLWLWPPVPCAVVAHCASLPPSPTRRSSRASYVMASWRPSHPLSRLPVLVKQRSIGSPQPTTSRGVSWATCAQPRYETHL